MDNEHERTRKDMAVLMWLVGAIYMRSQRNAAGKLAKLRDRLESEYAHEQLAKVLDAAREWDATRAKRGKG